MMSKLFVLITSLLYFISHVSAASLIIRIPGSTLLPNPATLPASTHATLTSSSGGAPLKALLRKDNTLIFPSIATTGTHLLKIYSKDYVFAPYRIDIVPSSSDTASTSSTLISGAFESYPGTQWSDHGIALLPSSSPTESFTLYAKLLTQKSYYIDRVGFSPLTLLKNPMILLGGVALLFTFGLPKLMENMDPEMKAEYDEMQKNGPMAGINRAMAGQGPASSGASNFDLAGYLAGAQSGGVKSSGSAKPEGATNVRERRK